MTTVHNPPQIPAFRDEPNHSPISEIALRVVVERSGWRLSVIGTATLISGFLAITARHVLEHAIQEYGRTDSDNRFLIGDFQIKLYQVLPGPQYRIWRVVSAWPCDTDIALLHLALDRATLPGAGMGWKVPKLRVLPPPVGEKVVAFGYRSSEIKVTSDKNGVHHIELNDRPTTSIGAVRQMYPSGRDSVMLPFPCFEIEARFDAGMSGGMVIDEGGRLCGLICSSFESFEAGAPPVSYVVSLWPTLKTVISADRQGSFPKGVPYPVIDLVLGGQIGVWDLHQLDPAHFRSVD